MMPKNCEKRTIKSRACVPLSKQAFDLSLVYASMALYVLLQRCKSLIMVKPTYALKTKCVYTVQVSLFCFTRIELLSAVADTMTL
jgi:hypothetical protein